MTGPVMVMNQVNVKEGLLIYDFIISKFQIHFKPKHRKSIWVEKMTISDPVHAVLLRIKSSHHICTRHRLIVLGFFVESVKRTLFKPVKNLEIKHISLPSPYKIISEIWMKYFDWLWMYTKRQTRFGDHWCSSLFPQYECFSLRKKSFENRLFASIFHWTRAQSFATLVTIWLRD